MRKIFILLLFIIICVFLYRYYNNKTPIEKYFDSIRNDEVALIQFMQNMPKGGDLHHHYSGSVYAETYLDYAVNKNYYLNIETLNLSETKTSKTDFTFSELLKQNKLNYYKDLLLHKWSIKDFEPSIKPSYKQFFETFGYFSLPSNGSIKEGLLEIKERAKKENVQYIETMFKSIPNKIDLTDLKNYEDTLLNAQNIKDTNKTLNYLQVLYSKIQSKEPNKIAKNFNDSIIKKYHTELNIDDSNFTMRYQNYILRSKTPLVLFLDIIIAFESANNSDLVVGVNIVGPEHGDIALRDYWLHMQMFKFIKLKYPNVKCALHAGELNMNLVKPEDLTWHINDAIYVAKANRIGHGVDMPFEKKSDKLLKYMKEKNIAIEINLVSNDFILNIKDDKHPIIIYKNAKIPIVISTDDAGVLRTNLTTQYALLAKRYKSITYKEIKQFVFNSIDYSFIKDNLLKEKLKNKLKNKFLEFENNYTSN